jgi:small conductance mechanosensitive channel
VAGSLGVVRKITLRTTRLDTQRNEVVILPNQTMVTEKIVNHTMRPRLRVDVPVGIAYRDDIAAARQALLATLAGDEDIRDKPEPQVVVTELAPSSVNLELRFWLKDPRNEIAMRLRYTEKAKEALEAAGIEMPYPQLTLHMDSDAVDPARVMGARRESGRAESGGDGPPGPAPHRADGPPNAAESHPPTDEVASYPEKQS